jgi:hypothetical protein
MNSKYGEADAELRFGQSLQAGKGGFMLFRSIRFLPLACGFVTLLAANSPVNAAPYATATPTPPAPGDGASSSAPSGSCDPAGDLRSANNAYKKANRALGDAKKALTDAKTAEAQTAKSVKTYQCAVDTLKGKLPATAPVPETSDYVKLKADLTAAEVELGNAKSKDDDAASKVTAQTGLVTQAKWDRNAALKKLLGQVDAVLKSLDDAAWPCPVSPPICPPMSIVGFPADSARPWESPCGCP